MSVDWVKIDVGTKIAKESKLKRPEKSCFLGGYNHNFEKFKRAKV